MSAAIRKLEQLLSRVQSRRAEPRTRVAPAPEAMPHIEPQHAQHIEPQHVEPLPLRPEMMRVPPPAGMVESLREAAPISGERSSRPATPLESAMGQFGQPSAPANLSPTPVAKVPQPAKAPAPPDDDLVLDDFDDGPPTIRPPEFDAAPPRTATRVDAPRVEMARPEASRFDTPHNIQHSKLEEDKPTRVAPALPDEPIRAEPIKPVRIATPEALAASPMTTVSTARAFSPKTFGQLVERSLALRPKR
jgi:hypothetical protein